MNLHDSVEWACNLQMERCVFRSYKRWHAVKWFLLGVAATALVVWLV